LAADRLAAEEHAHAGVLENWAPALMTESGPGGAVVAEKRAHAGKEFREKRQTRRPSS
jgi:IS5 family transposase